MSDPRTIDAPGTACSLQSHDCTSMVLGRGGLDEHHEHPLSLGGPLDGPKLALCPNHHRRAHALLRAFVEHDGKPPRTILRHYVGVEIGVATNGYEAWTAAGSPTISGWPCPAARA